MRRKILIADDDVFITTLYEAKLNKEGIDVTLASNGEEAIKKLQGFVPDIILLDLQMPRINGIQVLTYIRAHPALKNVPVIVFSNAVAGGLVDQAWAAGATKFITKNQCTPNTLIVEVQKVLDEAAVEAEVPPQNDFPVVPEKEIEPAPLQQIPPSPFSAIALAAELAPEVEQYLNAFRRSVGEEQGRETLLDLYQSIQPQLKSARQIDRLTRRGQLGHALEKLFEYLYEFPSEISESCRETLSNGVALLGRVYHKNINDRDPIIQSEVVLVIAEERTDRDAVAEILNREHIRTICIDSPELADLLLGENKFDLILVDRREDRGAIARGLELRGVPAVTVVDSRLYDRTVIGPGFITKPYVPAELTLKVVTRAVKKQLGQEGWA
jgi:CheY-like chemotaxis protein